MFKTPNTLINALALVIVLVSARPALAGPPLICYPFDTGSTTLLAWGSGPGWNTPDRTCLYTSISGAIWRIRTGAAVAAGIRPIAGAAGAETSAPARE